MSFLDKVVAAITPPKSDETRMEARAKARHVAEPGDWLSQVLDHHDQIEAAFETARRETSTGGRTTAMKQLGLLLTGHSNAEESVLYPSVADSGHKTHAGMAYEEQAMAKIEMALLEKLDPMSQEWLDKLKHIRGAMTHHMYSEESDWILDPKREVPADEQAMMTKRYRQEIARYAADELA